MPNRIDMANVLLQLSEVATETGVNFQSITPHDPVSLGSYQRVGIDLIFEGHFYDLSDFLFRLRNLVGVYDGKLAATGRLFSVDAISFDEGEPPVPAGEGHPDRSRRTCSATELPRRFSRAAIPAADGSTPPTTSTTPRKRRRAADSGCPRGRHGRRSRRMSARSAKASSPRKVKRQKQFVAIGSLVLLALLGFQLPKMMGGGSETATPAATSPVPTPGSPLAAVPTTLPDTDRPVDPG